MPDTAVATRPCVVCSSTRRTMALDLGDRRVLRCAGCGLHTLDPEPAAAQLVEAFDDGSIYEGAFTLRADIMARHDVTLASLERRVRPGSLLDVGCGPGFFLEAARDRGWHATGVDPSPFSVEQVKSLGFEAHRGLLHEVDLPESSFDAVALLQVVEHLIDPLALLEGCRTLLKPGGALLVATPNPRSLLARTQKERFNYWIPPVHCTWYAPKTLKRLLSKAGFAAAHVSTWSARARTQHDGLTTLLSTKLAGLVPSRVHWSVADAIAGFADAIGSGTIVEATALRPETGA